MHIFEMEWGWGWVVIGHERGWYPQNKLTQQIIISYLINYSSSVPLSLSLFSTSISLPSMCISLWSSYCWQSQNSEQLSPALIELHLFIYLFIYSFIYLHWVETHLQGFVCKISSGAIFIPVESMVGLSDFSPSFLPQPYSHGFSWSGLPITQFSHMIAT